jgi:hypothetical protein
VAGGGAPPPARSDMYITLFSTLLQVLNSRPEWFKIFFLRMPLPFVGVQGHNWRVATVRTINWTHKFLFFRKVLNYILSCVSVISLLLVEKKQHAPCEWHRMHLFQETENCWHHWYVACLRCFLHISFTQTKEKPL